MGHKKLIEKLLNEGLELLSSEKNRSREKVLSHYGRLLVWVVWKLFIMKEFVVKTEL